MTKSPDEIKKGLECCIGDDKDICCDGCAYCGEARCVRKMTDDTLALIQQLEAQNAELSGKVGQLETDRHQLIEKVEQLQAERDAAVKAILNLILSCYLCDYCKHSHPINICPNVD